MRLLTPTLAGACILSFSVLFTVSAQQPAAPPAAPAQTPAAPAAGRARGAAPIQQTVWSPKAVKPTGYTGVHKPHTKLADVLAKHKGATDWVESIVDDETLHGDYIMMGPGKKTPKRANVDTREWWIVRDGQIRFTIDGQEPFVASKGFLVQVPYRTFYTMETVGDQPSLRYEVNIARARKIYPAEETPVPAPGVEYVRARIAGRGNYEDSNRMKVDFNQVAAGAERGGEWIADRNGFANIILGRGGPAPDPSNKGHFHVESSEHWMIMLGQIHYTIEGVPPFVAEVGDIVYVPKQTWHLASPFGDGQTCRLAMNAFSDLGHSYEAAPAAGGRGTGRGPR